MARPQPHHACLGSSGVGKSVLANAEKGDGSSGAVTIPRVALEDRRDFSLRSVNNK